MYELKQVGASTYYLEAPSKIGIVVNERGEAILIDSGNDKDAGRKVRKILDANGWRLKAIVNTHSNADHIGGNQYLQNQTDCLIFAGGIEKAFTRYPLLEPSFLYGGYPFKELRHKFLMAKPSRVFDLADPQFPEEIEIIPLPGHFFDMVGFKTKDNVLFLADCLSSKETLDKYKVGFIYDVKAYLQTLEKVKTLKARCFIPSHAPATESIEALADTNIEQVFEIKNDLLSMLEEEKSFEKLLKGVFDLYGLRMDPEQYVLVGSTIRSYLSWMKEEGWIEMRFKDNRMLWQAK